MKPLLGGSRITEVRFKPAGCKESNQHMVGYFTVILNGDLYIGDGKVICRDDGRRFISFPSRLVKTHCDSCHHPIGLKYNFCPNCGVKQEPRDQDNGERKKHYVDLIHPICPALRDQFEKIILSIVEMDEYYQGRSDYRSSYDYPYIVTWDRYGSFQAQQSKIRMDATHEQAKEGYYTTV